MYLIKGYITARAQLVTFILFILLVYNIEKFLESKKIRHVVALLIIHILIANLHVAVWPFTFVLYLPYIAEYILALLLDMFIYKKNTILFLKHKIKTFKKKQKDTEKLEQKLKEIQEKNEKIKIKQQEESGKIILNNNKNTKWLILIMIIALFTGLLTPLREIPYTYSYLTFIGNTMNSINEHLPMTLINNIPIIVTLALLFGVIAFSKARIKMSDVFMLGGLGILMLATRRQQSMFALIGSIAFTRLLVQAIGIFFGKKEEEYSQMFMSKFSIFVLTAIVLLLSINMYEKKMKSIFIVEKTYPVKASEWILKNIDIKEMKLYNEYNYGSYLLYKGIPVFVDSRADLYAPEFNTPTGNKKDGRDIFSDFINCSSIGTYYGDTFNKYGITHVILYKKSKINMLIKKADSEKYKELYSDDNFIIYKVLKY